jgi:hypothetical protein
MEVANDRPFGPPEQADNARDDPTLEALINTLGSFGFRWLVACAAFPSLRLPITLHLGAALKRADGEPPPSESVTLAISALPWFRQGWMPTKWRAALLQKQTSADRATVRDALAGLAFAVVDAKYADNRGRVTVASVPISAPKGFLADWKAWRMGLPSSLEEQNITLEGLLPVGAFRSIKSRISIAVSMFAAALAALVAFYVFYF